MTLLFQLMNVDDLELAVGRWWEELNKRSGTDKNCTAVKNNFLLLF